MLWSSRLQFYPPDSEQLAASFGEIAREVDVLKAVQRPGQTLQRTLLEDQRNDALLITALIQCSSQFPFDPHGACGCRRNDEDEPVASVQGRADFIMPLLRTNEVDSAEPEGNAVVSQHPGEPMNKPAIARGVRKKNFLWAPPPACLHAGWRRVDSIRNNRATSRAVFARLSPAFTVGNRLRIHGICDEGRNITGTTRFRNLGSVNA